jgi:mono/diheme cytochrome c family protein
MVFEVKRTIAVTAACGALGLGMTAGVALAATKGDPLVARGKYVVTIAGCNDCHTAHYAEADGKVAEKDWLQGDILGWKGPWGTTYAINLRNYMQKLTEAQWVAKAKNLQARPPMPAVNVRQMTDQDLKGVYRYVKSLGPGGNEAPEYVPPDKTPNPPFVSFPSPSPPPGAGAPPPAAPQK